MATLTPYLNFYGKCTEAMNFIIHFNGIIPIAL